MTFLAKSLDQAADGFPVLALAVIAVALWLANRPVRPRPLVGPPREPGAWRLRPGRWLDHDRPGQVPTLGPQPPAVWRQAGLDARPGLPGAGRPQMPAPVRPLSPRYQAYMDGLEAGDSGAWGGWFWPEKRRGILDWYISHQETGGRCLLGLVCGGQAPATQLDHCGRAAGYKSDYAELFRETPRTVRPVCRDCHVRRTELQRQGIDAWTLAQGRSIRHG